MCDPVNNDLTANARVNDAVIRDHRARSAGSYGETAARYHVAGVEASIVRDDLMEQLIGVVNGDHFARLRVDGRGNEHVVFQHTLGHCAAPLAEVQIWAEHVIPLRADWRREARAAEEMTLRAC